MTDQIRLAALREMLKARNAVAEGALLDRFLAYARQDGGYGELLDTWLSTGATQDLRAVAMPFGAYWSNPAFAGAVDGLDAAATLLPQMSIAA